MSTTTADSAPSRDADDNSPTTSASGSAGTLFERPTDPTSNLPAADLDPAENQGEVYGECHETADANDQAEAGRDEAGRGSQISPETPHASSLRAQAAARMGLLLERLGLLREWCHRHAAPHPDGDDADLSWKEALVETVARVSVVARYRHMRALIILFLLCAGLYSTSGVPVLGPSVNLAVWPLQAVSVALVWIGMAVPWARGHSFGSMFRDGALSGGESVYVLVPSALLVVLGGASYFASAILMGAGSGSWGLFKVTAFVLVSALATATAAYEAAAVSRCAGQVECGGEA